jgi:hypothetical protein
VSYLFRVRKYGKRTKLLHVGSPSSFINQWGVNSYSSPNSLPLFSSISVEVLQHVMRVGSLCLLLLLLLPVLW